MWGGPCHPSWGHGAHTPRSPGRSQAWGHSQAPAASQSERFAFTR